MSIKDFFNKKEVVLEDRSKLTSSIESSDLIEEIREQNQSFIPDVDFSDPKNFVRFGSAKEYYEGSIKRIYEQYPYDGSEAEKLQFYNDSTYLDQWLFDNKYPKSTGYAVFSAGGWGTGTTITDYGKPNNLEYIYSAGGLREASLLQHTGSNTISSGQLKNVFDKGIKHDADKNRTLNYRMKMDDGLTIQFWMKKDAFDLSKTKREVILDLWNGQDLTSNNYGRLLLEIDASKTNESVLRLTTYSGSSGIIDQPIALSTYGTTSIANGVWQHHTITVKAASQKLEIKYYNNGILNSGSAYSTTNTLGEIPYNINAFIGALQTTASTSYTENMIGAGKLSASFDDFRYWKKELDPQYIKRTWFYPIGGGSNSDDNRTSLGVYYKFNEGVVGNADYDSVVLDYSGRIANGTWTGYISTSRNTGSAYVSSSVLQSEPGDPIIRVDHPNVQSLITEMATSGSNFDRDNVSRMYDMVPSWLREEDTNDGINYLMQIMSSYFDTLYCQIKELPKLKDKNYFDGGNMPYEFVDRLLQEKGMLVPNSFVSSEILNTFWQRDDQNNYFEQSIEKTKRQIYYNIYNNLEFILKSKGTEKSFRNLLRCFGVDDEVIKLNLYTDQATHYIKDRYKNSSVKSKFINFFKNTRFEGSITQTSSSINSLTYISGSDSELLERNNAFTIEGDVIFPEPKNIEDSDYFVADFLSSSLFGFHEADPSDSTNYTFGGTNTANLQFYAVKDPITRESAKFIVRNSNGSVIAESDFFEDVYSNSRWNFALTVEPVGYPFAGSFLSSSNPNYNIRLYGVTHNNEEIKSQFTLTASVNNATGTALLSKPKRIYVGANKTNFTGSTLTQTDVKFGSIRMWMDKLSDEAIQQHNLDPKNYGHNKIYGSPTAFFHQISNTMQIPAMDSLILHWNFDQNKNSDSNGKFIVEDFSSGSAEVFNSKARGTIEVVDHGGGLAKYASLPTTDGFTITDSDGNAIEYFFDNTGTKGASGTVTGDGVVVQINGLTQAVLIASQIVIAIESANGHGASGTNTIKVLQRNPPNENFIDLVHIGRGSQGNNAITPGSLPSSAIVFSGLTDGGVATGDQGIDNKYGWASNIIERENKGLGLGFPASEEVFINEFIFARRKELPEISFTDDRITIMGDEEEFFIEDEDTTDNVFSLEKSMNQSISEEMIRTFATMKEYANLFAKPVDYYRHEYKRLRKARSLFFERTTGNPDFDKFTEYFKWIDTSISFFIEQLKPASVTFTEGVANVVESHIFERPKNDRKFPTVKTLQSTIGSMRGIGELDYNWKFGHSPEYKSSTDNIHCLWKKEREKRTDFNEREDIRKILASRTSGIIKRLGNTNTTPPSPYIADGYAEAVRRFSKPYKLSVEASTTIHGGTNYNQNKNRDFIYDNIKPHGAKTSLGIPVNVVVVGVGPGQGIINNSICDDQETPNEKEKYSFRMTVGKDSSGDGQNPSTGSLDLVYEVKSAYGSPFNIISGNVDDGANRPVDSNYKDNVILTNLHSDTTYMSNDIPMQGPFTRTWVGGRQHRNVKINRYKAELSTVNKIDDQYTRPEAFRILFGEHPDESVQDGALGIVGPDYGGPYPDTTRESAIYYRGLRGKRPYNIQNLQGDQYRQGNYTRKYEYFNTVGRLENNSRFKKAGSERTYEVNGVFLPAQIKAALPQTTHPMTLVGISISDRGNTFGVGESNRINDNIELVYSELYGSGSFEITGATIYEAPYSASLTVEPPQNPAAHQTYYFQVTGATSNVASGFAIYTGSFDIAAPPIAPQHDYVSFKVSGSSGLSDGDLLQLTASSTNKLIEVDVNNSKSGAQDILVTTGSAGFNHSLYSTIQSIVSGSSTIGSGSFSLSFWFNPGTAETDSGQENMIQLYEGGTTAFMSKYNSDDIRIWSYAPGDNDYWDVQVAGVDHTWMHVVLTFDREAGAFTSYKNGSVVSTSNYTSGDATNIGNNNRVVDKFVINLYRTSYNDVVVWNKILTPDDASTIYNSGNAFNYSTFVSASNILEWYKMGYEDYWQDIGYTLEDTLDTYGGSISRYISSSYGVGNTLSISHLYDGYVKFTSSYGDVLPEVTLTNAQIWNQLKTDLDSQFSGYTATYISGATDAQFFLRKDAAGSNTVSVTETGTSFDNLVSGSGATAVASNLEDGHTISISGSTFTVKQTNSGSAATDLVVGESYRKALSWPSSGVADVSLRNTSFAFPDDSTAISVSFWFNKHSNNDAVFVNISNAAFTSRCVDIMWHTSKLRVKVFNGASAVTAFDISGVSLHQWYHVTLTVPKDLTVNPQMWINGVAQSLEGGYSHGGTLNVVDRIYIGDWINADTHEVQGDMQDTVIWNTQLNQEDANVLYNSGSWLDIHSHPSASHIWDWWMLGEESGITQASGSALGSTGVYQILPTIGRHILTVASNTQVFVTDGVIESSKDAATWRSHVATQIEAVTNYSASVSSNTINMDQTSSAVISDSLTNSNNTFTNEAVFGLDEIIYTYVSGAVPGGQLRIEDQLFIVSTASSPATWASSSSGISINSTSSNFWSYMSSAIDQYLPQYTPSYYSFDNEAYFFVRRNNAGDVANDTLSSTGISSDKTFFDLRLATGSAGVASSLQEGDTITIEGTVISIKHQSSGSSGTTISTGQQYRKAFRSRFDSSDTCGLGNASYATPTSNKIAMSFWLENDMDPSQYHPSAGKQYVLDSDAIQIYFDMNHGGVFANTRVYIKLIDASGNSGSYYFSPPGFQLWNHHAIIIDKTDVDTPPIVYKNGELITVTTENLGGTGNLKAIGQLRIADSLATTSDRTLARYEEFHGGLQDFVIWNTDLNIHDTRILYNSGSWFDMYSHPSASYIWDWWALGEEKTEGLAVIAQNSGSSLSSGTPITSITPEVGRHTLTIHNNSNILITDGVVSTTKASSTFWNEITQSFKNNTILTGSYTTSSATQLYLTASSTLLANAFTLSKAGGTFDIVHAPFKGLDDITTYVAGAVDNDYIEFDTTRFIIDTDNSNAGGSYAEVGGHYYIFSSGSSDQFWTRLSGAMSASLTNYTVTTSSTGDTISRFTVRSRIVPNSGFIPIINGISYSNVNNVAASIPNIYETSLTNVTQRESDFLTGSTRNKTVITSRFSAPGGVEVQTYGYLDAYAREYSVHNNLNYRNLSIRGPGSGENGTMRVNSQANTRDGLRTLYQRPMGLAGTDSVYGAPDSSNYEYTASFHKIPKNTLVTPRSSSNSTQIVERSNNYNYQSIIPASDYNYSWATSSLGNNYNVRSGTQKVFGYWPKDGINKVNGVFDSAITFPSSSDIVGV